MSGAKIAGLVGVLLAVLAGALVGIYALLPDEPPAAPQRVNKAADRLTEACFRADFPLPEQQRTVLTADARTLADELREHPGQTYSGGESDPDYTLRSLMVEVADAIDRNPACRSQARTLRRAIRLA